MRATRSAATRARRSTARSLCSKSRTTPARRACRRASRKFGGGCRRGLGGRRREHAGRRHGRGGRSHGRRGRRRACGNPSGLDCHHRLVSMGAAARLACSWFLLACIRTKHAGIMHAACLQRP
eukprot:362606-Chlamydomonas_euryale.AAC.4